MACVLPTSIKRPNMNQVVVEIQDCLTIELSCKNENLVTDSTISFENFFISVTVESSPMARWNFAQNINLNKGVWFSCCYIFVASIISLWLLFFWC